MSKKKIAGTRKLTMDEARLLRRLAEVSDLNLSMEWLEGLVVKPMDDGGMGSFLIFPAGIGDTQRLFGQEVSRLQFKDQDGIEVSVSLNVDQFGQLFEVDIWKVDFSPLIRIPPDI